MNSEVHFLHLCYFPFFPPLCPCVCVTSQPHFIFKNWRTRGKKSPVILPLQQKYFVTSIFFSSLEDACIQHVSQQTSGAGSARHQAQHLMGVISSHMPNGPELGIGTFTISDLIGETWKGRACLRSHG